MKKIYSTIMMLAMMIAALSFTACGGSDSDDDYADYLKNEYDILIINGEKYACFGYRSLITYQSTWDLSKHTGEIRLPCGKLSDAQKGEYDYDYAFMIKLKGNQDLKIGSKLEDFSPTFTGVDDWSGPYDYDSGSATITDKKDDKYITIKFNSFKFGSGSKSYTLDGTVQLDLDED
jgi:hypothetical protein